MGGDNGMAGVLFLGLLLGMQHALEADHLAAVASLTAHSRSKRNIVRQGAVWGLGHILTLAVFAGAVLVSERAVSPHLTAWLEYAVGVMLILLGASVLWRIVRERIHFHVHRHADGQVHLHAHSPARDGQPHQLSEHDHVHPGGFPTRSRLVGMMHGLAGSAALVVVAATALRSPLEGLIYVTLFGLGPVAGMALLSAVIAVPLSLTAHLLTWVNRGLQAVIGLATMILGGIIVF
jgi:ABC-type nickel/cobalt efflux system permease component RcnA